MVRAARGFTLLEMVVVLAILALLATVAVRSLDGQLDQSKYDATIIGMQNIQDAVIGSANQRAPDGTRLITGFAADMGRLPKATQVTVGGVAQLQLQELWDNPNGLAPFGIKQAIPANIANPVAGVAPIGDEDDTVFVPCGWRGPYLRLNIGQTTLADGWGNPFEFLKKDRTPITAATDEVSIIRSLGQDNVSNNSLTNDYREDLYLNFNTNQFLGTATPPDYPAVAASDSYHASPLQVAVKNADGSNFAAGLTITLKYFGPDPATGKIKVITAIAPPTDATTGSQVNFTLSDDAITIGPRILRAYQTSTGKKSGATRVILAPNGNLQDVLF